MLVLLVPLAVLGEGRGKVEFRDYPFLFGVCFLALAGQRLVLACRDRIERRRLFLCAVGMAMLGVSGLTALSQPLLAFAAGLSGASIAWYARPRSV